MNKYTSTFIPGLAEFSAEQVQKPPVKAQVLKLLEGLITYQSKSPYLRLDTLKYFNNSFLCLAEIENLNNIEKYIKEAFNHQSEELEIFLRKHATVKIVYSREGEAKQLNPQILLRIEQQLVKQWGLKLEKEEPETEFWIYERSQQENYGFIGFRITKHKDYRKTLQPGELKPEITFAMSTLAEIQPTDTVLDPFSAFGGIIKSVSRNFEFKNIYSIDSNEKNLKIQKEKFNNSRIKFLKADGFKLSSFSDNTFNKIITHALPEHSDRFPTMFKEFERLLAPNGKIVIATSEPQKLLDAIEAYDLKLTKSYNILVADKNTGIFSLSKIA